MSELAWRYISIRAGEVLSEVLPSPIRFIIGAAFYIFIIGYDVSRKNPILIPVLIGLLLIAKPKKLFLISYVYLMLTYYVSDVFGTILATGSLHKFAAPAFVDTMYGVSFLGYTISMLFHLPLLFLPPALIISLSALTLGRFIKLEFQSRKTLGYLTIIASIAMLGQSLLVLQRHPPPRYNYLLPFDLQLLILRVEVLLTSLVVTLRLKPSLNKS